MARITQKQARSLFDAAFAVIEDADNTGCGGVTVVSDEVFDELRYVVNEIANSHAEIEDSDHDTNGN